MATGAMMSFTTVENTTSTEITVAKGNVTIKLKNTGSDVAELYYQASPGSKDLTSFRIQKGQTRELTVEVGTVIYYNVKGGKGDVIATVSADMNGKTINV
jgi:hypothetical protein